VSPWSSVSCGYPIVAPDTGELRRAGVSAREISRLWVEYYRAIGQLASLAPIERGAHFPCVGEGGSAISGTGSEVLGRGSSSSQADEGGAVVGCVGGERSPSPVVAGEVTTPVSSVVETSSASGSLVQPPKRKCRRGTRGRSRKNKGEGQRPVVYPSWQGPLPAYAQIFDPVHAPQLAARFGSNPSLRRVLTIGPGFFKPWHELTKIRFRVEDPGAVCVGEVPGAEGLTAFTTLVRSVPESQLRKSWRGPVFLAGGRAGVPGPDRQGYRLW